MKKVAFNVLGLVGVSAVMLLSTGCAAFRMSVKEVDPTDGRHYDQNYDQTDLQQLSKDICDELLNSPFMAKQTEPPIMMIAQLSNDTNEHIDTKSLTDKMRVTLLKSGKIRFVNETSRKKIMDEQGYQAANVTPGQNAAIGQQLGVKYMLTGSFSKLEKSTGKQVRVSKTKFSYYKLTMEVTDISTGEMVWIDDHEIAREARRPLIGW
ncbi:MAG: penicillin-binding protein activator LpoB [Kiritimatiellae bacterium]|nr:penicillin-binding protein activator LpoB [Kiritimatiellia bacterium]